MRLVDADILLKEGWVLHKMVDTTLHEMPLNHPDVPTVDAVEVVRCKDCRYYESENHNCVDEMGYARIWEESDFCSFGERRKDERK